MGPMTKAAMRRGLAFAMLSALTASVVSVPARGEVPLPTPERPIQSEGTVSFELTPGKSLRNGIGQQREQFVALRIPRVADVRLAQSETNVAIAWRWAAGIDVPHFQTLLPELPGNMTFYMQFTWEADLGRFEAYFNGLPMIDAGATYEPWKMEQPAAGYEIPDSPATVSDVKLLAEYLPRRALQKHVPDQYLGRDADVLGQDRSRQPLPIADRRGRLLLDLPLASQKDIDGWVLEGPGQVTFEDGWMQMRSTRPDAKGDVNGHIVNWCPRDFPASFVAQWEVQVLSDWGLNIVFFAAKGENGEDIFAPNLPPRDGTFSHYIKGAVKSYHISYHANTPNSPGRSTSNLRKNNRFLLVSAGPVAIPASSRDVHQVRLVKDGAHIQLLVDGRVSIDYTDPGTDRYGPVYGAGKLGLRQMQWTVARYRNLKIWELVP
jgi:hypothetical protein